MLVTHPNPVRGCLLGGLAALRTGRDPVLAGLEVARHGLAARRALWVSPHAGQLPVLCLQVTSRRCPELPDWAPAHWLASAPPGRVLLFGPRDLARDPRTRGEGVEWATVARPAIGGGVLWLETQGPHRFSEETISELVVALDHLDHLAPLRRLGADARRLTRMGEWAGGVAHDLRNKLNLALLASHKLKAEGGIEGRELQVALEGAVELCQDFLREGAARQTEGQLLSDVIQAEAKAAAHLSGRNGLVRVEAKCSADLTVPSDGSRLRRVLSNLILNAIAASPPKGCVRIQAQRESGGGVELTVEDRGRGMSRGELQRFLRAGQSRTGTGFGTASVLTCVEELGAELHVESERSVGTRICLRLPGSVRRDGEMAIDRAV